ncbi:MAG TPA: hypothetical protein VGG23_05135 [Acidimicrobiales bacterium]
MFTTVSTVPKGNVGLAHLPAGASEYHVASPTSWFDVARGAAVVVVVGGEVVVVERGVVVVVVGADVVGVTGGAVVVVVAEGGA